MFEVQETTSVPAEIACNALGGHLASVHDSFLNTFLTSYAAIFFTNSTSANFWIGATNEIKKGNWSWTDGSPWDFTEWREPPKERNGESCASVTTASGLWNVDNCYQKYPYVCEIGDGSSIPTSKTTTTTKVMTSVGTTVSTKRPVSYCPENPNDNDTKRVYFEETNSCYMALGWNRWSDDVCQIRGGKLASIHSEAEHKFINSLYGDWKFVGLYRNHIGDDWKWTDGTPVDYIKWFPGYPNNNKPSYYCGILRDGFANENCQQSGGYGVICKTPSLVSPTDVIPTIEVPTESPPSKKCGFGWKYYSPTHSCYLYGPEFTWADAELYCVSLGGHLASLHSYDELTFADKYVALNSDSKWIGLHAYNSSYWNWTDSSKVDYSCWTSSGSDTSWGFCGELWDAIIFNKCSINYYKALCKKPATEPTPPNKCQKDGVYFDTTDSCYYPTPSMSWHEAEKYCIQRKGHLVSTHNDAEFQFTQTNLTNTIIWIGLHSTDNCTTWEWTDESSFDFPKWVTNSSPVCNNQNSNTCIFEIVHGFANFNNCTHSLPGVCKMTQ